MHLKDLLQPLLTFEIGTDTEKCAKLLDNPGGPAWNDPKVEKALTARLQDCYELYRGTMEDLLTLLIRLAKDCKVQDAEF